MTVTYVVKIYLFGKDSFKEFADKAKALEWMSVLMDNDVAFEVDIICDVIKANI